MMLLLPFIIDQFEFISVFITPSDADRHVVIKQGVLSFGVKATEGSPKGVGMRDNTFPRMLVRQDQKAVVQKQRNSSRVGMLSGWRRMVNVWVLSVLFKTMKRQPIEQYSRREGKSPSSTSK